jgi:2-dehydro-3-deoxyphosphooctonate aldolase (KDO 8-P synthase)
VLQTPALLCRQTDFIHAVALSGKPVNIKKGQWLQPEGMKGATAKVRSASPHGQRAPLAVTERGTFFGYGDLVVDMRNFARTREAADAPVIYDATHSVQQPGRGDGGASGGLREFIPPLMFAALSAGAQGLFIETHPDPDHAPSDGPNMVFLDQFPGLIDRAVDLWSLVRS